jgi:sugar/nucleoside kinase (ribokinase family)
VPQGEIVSTVGAGDAFAAGLLYGLHEDLPIETALRYGVCAAAACLGGGGTSDGVKPLAECLALEARHGARGAD